MFATRSTNEQRRDEFGAQNTHNRGSIYNSSSRAFREWAAGGSGFSVSYKDDNKIKQKILFGRDDDGFPIVQSPTSSMGRSGKVQDKDARWPVESQSRCSKLGSSRAAVQSQIPDGELVYPRLKNSCSSRKDGARHADNDGITRRLLHRNTDPTDGKEKQCMTNGSGRFFCSVGRNGTAFMRNSAQEVSDFESHGKKEAGLKRHNKSTNDNPNTYSVSRNCTNRSSSKNPTVGSGPNNHEESVSKIRTKLHPKQLLSCAANANPFLKLNSSTSLLRESGSQPSQQRQHTSSRNPAAHPAPQPRRSSHNKVDHRKQSQPNFNSNTRHRSRHRAERKETRPDPRCTSPVRNNHAIPKPEFSFSSKPPPPKISCANINMDASDDQPKKQKRVWKSAVDPRTGKTYYYDAITRQTQWHKPIELASKSERAETERKEKKQRDFFAAMEANILRSMAQGVVPGTTQPSDSEEEEELLPLPPKAKRQSSKRNPHISRPKLVRTISAMDDTLLANLTKVEASDDDSFGSGDLDVYSSKKTSPTSVAGIDNHRTPSKTEEDLAVDEAMKMSKEMVVRVENPSPTRTKTAKDMVSKSLPRPNLAKRNTCGTIYIGSTMSAPDKDANIKCVCGVYRAHLLQSVREETNKIGSMRRRSSEVKFDEYEIFNDHPNDRRASSNSFSDKSAKPILNKQGSLQGIDSAPPTTLLFRTATGSGIEALSLESSIESMVPSLDDITNFYRDVFRRSQMEADCIIMSLIYIERLIKDTNGGVRPKPSNWRSILFSCMVMSSKVWDDLSMWNADFSQTCPRDVSFSLQRINELELAVLGCLKYNVKVTASEYAKYYFLLRSMLIRSGLAGGDVVNAPLNIEGVKKLEHMSANYQVNAETREEVSKTRSRRGKSVGDLGDDILSALGKDFANVDSFDDSMDLSNVKPPGNDPNSSSAGLKASLEHFVQL